MGGSLSRGDTPPPYGVRQAGVGSAGGLRRPGDLGRGDVQGRQRCAGECEDGRNPNRRPSRHHAAHTSVDATKPSLSPKPSISPKPSQNDVFIAVTIQGTCLVRLLNVQ
jgi:hypothetical protein